MEIMTMLYKVYVLPDEKNRVTAINSGEFIADLSGWVQIDEGEGDKFHHAQNNYLPKPIADERGIYRYKLEDGVVVERTAEEMDADYVPPITPEPSGLDSRVAALEEQLAAYEAAYAEGVQNA